MGRNAILPLSSVAIALVLSLVSGAPAALSAQQAPRSLLPEDLDTPPPKVVRPQPLPVREAPAAGPETREDVEGTADTAAAAPALASPASAGASAARPLPNSSASPEGPVVQPELAGILATADSGFAAGLFAGSDGRFLGGLLDRIDAPLGSRWMQVLLQRALLARAEAPAGMPAADWVAARTRVLVAMGAANDAHRLVSAIATDRYTNRLYGAALRAALASADPVALCPLSTMARARNVSPSWELVDAMCMAILGDDIGSTAQFDSMRRRNAISAFDIGLAERIASTTGSARRGANPEWEPAGHLTAWRIGLATAASFEIPEALLENATPAQQGWLVRLPNLPLAQRRAAAAAAAATGAISSAELNRLLAAAAGAGDAAQVNRGPTGLLRRANVAPQTDERIAALRQLWGTGAAASLERYGWQVASAAAAAKLSPGKELADDAPAVVASLLAAGMTAEAASWWPVADGADARHRAELWAQLVAVAGEVPVEAELFDRWSREVPAHRAALLAAGLSGLGRGSAGGTVERIDNLWTRALDRAVENNRPGEVLLLAAIAFRGSWAEVAPDYLRRIAAALVATGHGAEARLIVAEAASRG